MRISTARIAVALVLCGALAWGCGDQKNPVSPLSRPWVLEPDFSLLDANPNSATSGQMVSPRQHLGQISAWYFGHST
jgi:hypothetical protein